MTVTERKRRNNPHQPVGRWICPAKRAAIYTCCRGCNVRRGVRPLSDAFGVERAAQIEARAAMPLRQEAA